MFALRHRHLFYCLAAITLIIVLLFAGVAKYGYIHVYTFGYLLQEDAGLSKTLLVFVDDASNSSDEYYVNKAATNQSGGNYMVPNIIHLIWFGLDKSFTFINYVSVRSVFEQQRPKRIMFHCDHLPIGPWWQRLASEVPLMVMPRQPPAYVGKKKLDLIYHQADVTKLEVLIKYGGIYIDCDVIVINSLNPLRVNEATVGREKPKKLIMGVMFARRNARFLRLWYDSYKHSYRPDLWDYNSGIVPFHLYTLRPSLLHIEPYRLTTPDWTERHLLWDTVIPWHHLYVIHVMTHKTDASFTPENIKRLNSTFGEVMRLVYYGSPTML